ncbi:TIM barrel protein [Siminovitchia sp. FSL H7-0308]|uniref:Sugar phosphate isomerase/epimerase n=1 Tax=Siminovitchia thermophila TaxID=1245522 RepID=A0ABS2RCL8_9BACI|nr:TIM barrel protein [Siminovitchia thermophila]MBM7716578.1 sugar phosphate isomerase/epimerase [Siminovitchia thermophila]ONK21324.1 sugar phosphate isomerase [Bacillus sp. VT-16-64]
MKSFRSLASIGIVLPKLYPFSQEEPEKFISNLLSILEDPFFTAVEVSYIADEKARQAVKKYTEYSGVEVIFNGGDAFRALQIDLSSLDSKQREASVEKCKMLIEHCYEMNAKVMHIVTGKYEGEAYRKQNIEAFIQSAMEICHEARKKAAHYELCISLEIGDRHVDRQYLLGPTHEAVSVAQKIRSEYQNFGLLLDQSHLPIMQENPVKSLWLAKDYLTHIHLGNSYIKDRNVPYFGDKHIPFGIQDSEVGVEELAQFIRTLHEIDFFKSPKPTRKPVVTFEVGRLEQESSQLVIANVKRTFLEAWEMA